MCLQLVEADLRFEAGEQTASEARRDNDVLTVEEATLSSIPAVHLTYDVIRSRVHIFSQLVEAWPECINILINHKQPMVCIFNIITLLSNVNSI